MGLVQNVRIEKTRLEYTKPIHKNYAKTPQFCGRKHITLLSDIFQREKNIELTKMKESDFLRDDFGTQYKGSKPLKKFFDCISQKERNEIMCTGQSTNDDGFAFSFLKTSDKNPVSTSEVRDCSVMYLHNHMTGTHFLYHIYRTNGENEVKFLLKNCMSENFTSAALVPGVGEWKSRIACYLPNIFKTLKEHNPNAPIRVFHNSSKLPEIVGYKGQVFEIKNKNGDMGQATFPIYDLRTYQLFYEIGKCNSLKELAIVEEKFNKSNYDIEVKRILDHLIEERKSVLYEIENCPTQDELDILTEKYTFPCWGMESMGVLDYNKALTARSFKITENK